MGKTICLVCLLCIGATPASAPLVPLTVCEVLRNLPSETGKDLAVLGRYSFREDGRWIGEQSCGPGGQPPLLWLVEENEAPKPPENFELDAAALEHKFSEMRRGTSLGKFRFGTPDYDRWAVVYGRLEARKGEEAKKAPANLVYRGSGVVIFLSPGG